MNQRVLAALQGIRDARSIKDWPRVKFLQPGLRELASKMSIPLYILGHISVPNLSPLQNAAIQRVVRAMVTSCDIPAWEKQALHRAIRIVRSNPMTVKKAFERASKKFDQLQSQPPCKCSQVSVNDGTIMEIEGHKALKPISVMDTTGNPLCPSDSLPLKGPKVRAQLLKDITKIADQIGAALPNLHRLLPPSLWVESGTNSRHVDAQAQRISDSHYNRIVDKGVGVMWGFCKHWLWGVVESFLKSEGYVSAPEGQHDVVKRIHNIIDKNGWDRDPAGRLAYLYLIGKAKSKNRWLWRPIAALP